MGGHHVALTAALAEAPRLNAETASLDAEASRRRLEASYGADAAEESQAAPSHVVAPRASNQVRTCQGL